jgi:hypothetical protein
MTRQLVNGSLLERKLDFLPTSLLLLVEVVQLALL